jgi:hypothetical protein
MLKKSVLILLVLAVISSIVAIEYSETGARQYMGAHLSELCGSGIMYRCVGQPLGFGIVMGGTANGKSGVDFKSSFNTGLMATNLLKDFDKTSFFYFLGGSYHYKEKRSSPESGIYDDDTYITKITEDYYYGMGLGFDLKMNDWGIFTIHWPLTLRDDGYISMYVPMASFLIRFK